MTLKLALPLMLVCSIQAAAAQDRIYLRRDQFSDAFMTSGEVLDFTGRTIRFRTQTAVREEPASLVTRVETSYPEAFKRGRTHFEAGRYDEAQAEWTDALKQEYRVWVQREIRSWLLRCHWRQDDWATAGEQFLKILESDSETQYWSLAPVIWAPVNLRDADRQAALIWIRSDTAVAKLLGASILLTDAAQGEQAVQVLERLTREVGRQVSGLARAQLWRRRAPMSPGDTEMESWRSHIAFLPASLRGGPHFVVGQALLARGDLELAAAEFLWVSVVDAEHEPTAACATLSAAEILARSGRSDEAERLFQETIARYPWSQAALDAKSQLKELDSSTAENR